jgi:hypothetical protein
MARPAPLREFLEWSVRRVHAPARRKLGVGRASNSLAFFSYPWVRYQERRFLSMGERNIRHAKRRVRIAVAPQGIRRPEA